MEIKIKVILVARQKLDQERLANHGMHRYLTLIMMQVRMKVQLDTITAEILMVNMKLFGVTQQILKHHGNYVNLWVLHFSEVLMILRNI